jgi:hypothetical protein
MEDFFENDIVEALEREQITLLEIEMEQLEKSETPKPAEAPERKKLKRELEQEALARLEDSARTEDDFNNVVTWWNRLDANRERRERYHEIGRSDVPLEWGMSADEIIIPSPTQHNFRKQMEKYRTFSKWFFYWFYPAHLLVLGLIKMSRKARCLYGFPTPSTLLELNSLIYIFHFIF